MYLTVSCLAWRYSAIWPQRRAPYSDSYLRLSPRTSMCPERYRMKEGFDDFVVMLLVTISCYIDIVDRHIISALS